MAKTKAVAKKRRKNGFTIPVAAAAPIVMVGARAVQVGFEQNSVTDVFNHLTKVFTGFHLVSDAEGTHVFFRAEYLKQGLLPLGLGLLSHKLATRFGINRAIANAGIPYIRI